MYKTRTRQPVYLTKHSLATPYILVQEGELTLLYLSASVVQDKCILVRRLL
jgi:hypothetical protein